MRQVAHGKEVLGMACRPYARRFGTTVGQKREKISGRVHGIWYRARVGDMVGGYAVR